MSNAPPGSSRGTRTLSSGPSLINGCRGGRGPARTGRRSVRSGTPRACLESPRGARPRSPLHRPRSSAPRHERLCATLETASGGQIARRAVVVSLQPLLDRRKTAAFVVAEHRAPIRSWPAAAAGSLPAGIPGTAAAGEPLPTSRPTSARLPIARSFWTLAKLAASPLVGDRNPQVPVGFHNPTVVADQRFKLRVSTRFGIESFCAGVRMRPLAPPLQAACGALGGLVSVCDWPVAGTPCRATARA
jgi:hypothetical protein